MSQPTGTPYTCPCGKATILAPGTRKYVCPECGRTLINETREAVKNPVTVSVVDAQGRVQRTP